MINQFQFLNHDGIDRRPRKFTYGNKRLESTKEALIKDQAFEILVLYYSFDFLMATLRLVLLYVFEPRKYVCQGHAS
jgi:hypothetical protein